LINIIKKEKNHSMFSRCYFASFIILSWFLINTLVSFIHSWRGTGAAYLFLHILWMSIIVIMDLVFIFSFWVSFVVSFSFYFIWSKWWVGLKISKLDYLSFTFKNAVFKSDLPDFIMSAFDIKGSCFLTSKLSFIDFQTYTKTHFN